MAGTLTNLGSQDILDYIGSNTVITGAGSLYMALWSADPTNTGSGGAEVADSGTDYVREIISFGTPTNAAPSVMTSNAPCEFNGGAAITGNWNGSVAIPGFAIFTAETGGVMIAHGTLDSAKPVTDGDTVSFASGAISISLT